MAPGHVDGWIDSERCGPRILPRQIIFPGPSIEHAPTLPPPARPHETRDRPIGVHARSYVTCQGGFRRLREDTRRVSPRAAFVAEMMTAIGIQASVPSSRAATSIATTRRASLRVAASASPRPGTKPARASTPVSRAISAPTDGLGPTGVTTVGPVPSLRELRQSIPKECFEPDLAESMKYAAYDLAALAACFGALSPVVVDHPWLLALYAPLTGTVMWMNFVVGHDCG